MDLPHLPRGKPKRILLLLLFITLVSVLCYGTAYNFNLSKWYKTMTVSFRRPELEPKSSPSAPEPTELLTTPTELLTTPTELLTTPTALLTTPTELLTTPTELLTTPTPQRPQPCSYNYISPGNAEEGRALLDSIAWPDTPPLSKPFSLNLATCPAKSSFTIVPQSGGWRVGDELTVRVQLRDYNGDPKRSGGDFLYGRLYNRALGAGVVGQVQDHLNGTFTVVFPLLWIGTANVQVVLVHTAESITVLKRLSEERPDRISFSSDFRLGRVVEQSACNVCLDPNKGPLCNFTDLHTGEQWFCYKPKTLACDTRVTHSTYLFSRKFRSEEEPFFQRGKNLKVEIKASGNSTATVLPKAGETKKNSYEPSGYYYGNQWRPLGGPAVRQFNNASAISACLQGKQLHMFGDSTTRQFYEFIRAKLTNLLRFEKYGTRQCGPFLALDQTNDFMMTFRCHGPPLRTGKINLSQLHHVATELERLAGGPDTVVVIGVWAHFGSYPEEVYYQRLMSIRRAVGRLLNRAPGTKVIVRTGNLKDISMSVCVYNSDWSTLQRDKVLRAVFKDSGVLLLEAWEVVQASDLPHQLHPSPQIIKLMVDMILSNTCPEPRG